MEYENGSLSIPLSPEMELVIEVWPFFWGGVAIAAGLLVIYLIRLFAPSRPAAHQTIAAPESLDVTALDAGGPPAEGPRIEVYGTPVRMVAVVVAPVGREAKPPSPNDTPELLEQLVPRLGEVILAHRPEVRIWPEQLSSHGFTNAFFNKVALPGVRGKGTPWCSIAGKSTMAQEPCLVGLVCRGERDNALGQILIQHEGQWNDVLRVKQPT